ncbi:MAG TPA: polyhydroxyalkanoic acid system family protein [Thermoanaerobaculia bacterium]
MKIIVPHHTTREDARKIVERRLGELYAQYGHYANESQMTWSGDRLDFSGKAKGFSGSGTIEITDTEVIIDAKLPLIAKPFEPRVRSTVEREAAAMFGRT